MLVVAAAAAKPTSLAATVLAVVLILLTPTALHRPHGAPLRSADAALSCTPPCVELSDPSDVRSPRELTIEYEYTSTADNSDVQLILVQQYMPSILVLIDVNTTEEILRVPATTPTGSYLWDVPPHEAVSDVYLIIFKNSTREVLATSDAFDLAEYQQPVIVSPAANAVLFPDETFDFHIQNFDNLSAIVDAAFGYIDPVTGAFVQVAEYFLRNDIEVFGTLTTPIGDETKYHLPHLLIVTVGDQQLEQNYSFPNLEIEVLDKFRAIEDVTQVEFIIDYTNVDITTRNTAFGAKNSTHSVQFELPPSVLGVTLFVEWMTDDLTFPRGNVVLFATMFREDGVTLNEWVVFETRPIIVQAPCRGGEFYDAEEVVCAPCSPGTANLDTANMPGACTPCDAGTVSAEYGATSCTPVVRTCSAYSSYQSYLNGVFNATINANYNGAEDSSIYGVVSPSNGLATIANYTSTHHVVCAPEAFSIGGFFALAATPPGLATRAQSFIAAASANTPAGTGASIADIASATAINATAIASGVNSGGAEPSLLVPAGSIAFTTLRASASAASLMDIGTPSSSVEGDALSVDAQSAPFDRTTTLRATVGALRAATGTNTATASTQRADISSGFATTSSEAIGARGFIVTTLETVPPQLHAFLAGSINANGNTGQQQQQQARPFTHVYRGAIDGDNGNGSNGRNPFLSNGYRGAINPGSNSVTVRVSAVDAYGVTVPGTLVHVKLAVLEDPSTPIVDVETAPTMLKSCTTSTISSPSNGPSTCTVSFTLPATVMRDGVEEPSVFFESERFVALFVGLHEEDVAAHTPQPLTPPAQNVASAPTPSATPPLAKYLASVPADNVLTPANFNATRAFSNGLRNGVFLSPSYVHASLSLYDAASSSNSSSGSDPADVFSPASGAVVLHNYAASNNSAVAASYAMRGRAYAQRLATNTTSTMDHRVAYIGCAVTRALGGVAATEAALTSGSGSGGLFGDVRVSAAQETLTPGSSFDVVIEGHGGASRLSSFQIFITSFVLSTANATSLRYDTASSLAGLGVTSIQAGALWSITTSTSLTNNGYHSAASVIGTRRLDVDQPSQPQTSELVRVRVSIASTASTLLWQNVTSFSLGVEVVNAFDSNGDDIIQQRNDALQAQANGGADPSLYSNAPTVVANGEAVITKRTLFGISHPRFAGIAVHTPFTTLINHAAYTRRGTEGYPFALAAYFTDGNVHTVIAPNYAAGTASFSPTLPSHASTTHGVACTLPTRKYASALLVGDGGEGDEQACGGVQFVGAEESGTNALFVDIALTTTAAQQAAVIDALYAVILPAVLTNATAAAPATAYTSLPTSDDDADANANANAALVAEGVNVFAAISAGDVVTAAFGNTPAGEQSEGANATMGDAAVPSLSTVALYTLRQEVFFPYVVTASVENGASSPFAAAQGDENSPFYGQTSDMYPFGGASGGGATHLRFKTHAFLSNVDARAFNSTFLTTWASVEAHGGSIGNVHVSASSIRNGRGDGDGDDVRGLWVDVSRAVAEDVVLVDRSLANITATLLANNPSINASALPSDGRVFQATSGEYAPFPVIHDGYDYTGLDTETHASGTAVVDGSYLLANLDGYAARFMDDGAVEFTLALFHPYRGNVIVPADAAPLPDATAASTAASPAGTPLFPAYSPSATLGSTTPSVTARAAVESTVPGDVATTFPRVLGLQSVAVFGLAEVPTAVSMSGSGEDGFWAVYARTQAANNELTIVGESVQIASIMHVQLDSNAANTITQAAFPFEADSAHAIVAGYYTVLTSLTPAVLAVESNTTVSAVQSGAGRVRVSLHDTAGAVLAVTSVAVTVRLAPIVAITPVFAATGSATPPSLVEDGSAAHQLLVYSAAHPNTALRTALQGVSASALFSLRATYEDGRVEALETGDARISVAVSPNLASIAPTASFYGVSATSQFLNADGSDVLGGMGASASGAFSIRFSDGVQADVTHNVTLDVIRTVGVGVSLLPFPSFSGSDSVAVSTLFQYAGTGFYQECRVSLAVEFSNGLTAADLLPTELGGTADTLSLSTSDIFAVTTSTQTALIGSAGANAGVAVLAARSAAGLAAMDTAGTLNVTLSPTPAYLARHVADIMANPADTAVTSTHMASTTLAITDASSYVTAIFPEVQAVYAATQSTTVTLRCSVVLENGFSLPSAFLFGGSGLLLPGLLSFTYATFPGDGSDGIPFPALDIAPAPVFEAQAASVDNATGVMTLVRNSYRMENVTFGARTAVSADLFVVLADAAFVVNLEPTAYDIDLGTRYNDYAIAPLSLPPENVVTSGMMYTRVLMVPVRLRLAQPVSALSISLAVQYDQELLTYAGFETGADYPGGDVVGGVDGRNALTLGGTLDALSSGTRHLLTLIFHIPVSDALLQPVTTALVGAVRTLADGDGTPLAAPGTAFIAGEVFVPLNDVEGGEGTLLDDGGGSRRRRNALPAQPLATRVVWKERARRNTGSSAASNDDASPVVYATEACASPPCAFCGSTTINVTMSDGGGHVTTPVNYTRQPGDTDGNCVFDIRDVTFLKIYINELLLVELGLAAPITGADEYHAANGIEAFQLPALDVTGDGAINSKDVDYLLRLNFRLFPLIYSTRASAPLPLSPTTTTAASTTTTTTTTTTTAQPATGAGADEGGIAVDAMVFVDEETDECEVVFRATLLNVGDTRAPTFVDPNATLVYFLVDSPRVNVSAAIIGGYLQLHRGSAASLRDVAAVIPGSGGIPVTFSEGDQRAQRAVLMRAEYVAAVGNNEEGGSFTVSASVDPMLLDSTANTGALIGNLTEAEMDGAPLSLALTATPLIITRDFLGNTSPDRMTPLITGGSSSGSSSSSSGSINAEAIGASSDGAQYFGLAVDNGAEETVISLRVAPVYVPRVLATLTASSLACRQGLTCRGNVNATLAALLAMQNATSPTTPLFSYVAQNATVTMNPVCANTTLCVLGTTFQALAPTRFSDRVCAPVNTTCNNGVTSYEVDPPTLYEDRVCAVIMPCNTSSQYETSAPTPTSDRVCAALTACDVMDEYELTPPTEFSDRVCANATTCNVTASAEFEASALSPSADRVCNATTVCDFVMDRQYEATMPTATTDRVCADITPCAVAMNVEFEAQAATPTSNTVCNTTTICDADNEYETSAPTEFSDRVCAPLTVCDVMDEYELTPPTEFSDRVCANLTAPCNVTGGVSEIISPTATSDRFCAIDACALMLNVCNDPSECAQTRTGVYCDCSNSTQPGSCAPVPPPTMDHCLTGGEGGGPVDCGTSGVCVSFRNGAYCVCPDDTDATCVGTTTAPPASPAGSTDVGIVLGSIFGVLILILLATAFIFRRAREKENKGTTITGEGEGESVMMRSSSSKSQNNPFSSRRGSLRTQEDLDTFRPALLARMESIEETEFDDEMGEDNPAYAQRAATYGENNPAYAILDKSQGEDNPAYETIIPKEYGEANPAYGVVGDGDKGKKRDPLYEEIPAAAKGTRRKTLPPRTNSEENREVSNVIDQMLGVLDSGGELDRFANNLAYQSRADLEEEDEEEGATKSASNSRAQYARPENLFSRQNSLTQEENMPMHSSFFASVSSVDAAEKDEQAQRDQENLNRLFAQIATREGDGGCNSSKLKQTAVVKDISSVAVLGPSKFSGKAAPTGRELASDGEDTLASTILVDKASEGVFYVLATDANKDFFCAQSGKKGDDDENDVAQQRLVTFARQAPSGAVNPLFLQQRMGVDDGGFYADASDLRKSAPKNGNSNGSEYFDPKATPTTSPASEKPRYFDPTPSKRAPTFSQQQGYFDPNSVAKGGDTTRVEYEDVSDHPAVGQPPSARRGLLSRQAPVYLDANDVRGNGSTGNVTTRSTTTTSDISRGADAWSPAYLRVSREELLEHPVLSDVFERDSGDSSYLLIESTDGDGDVFDM